MTDEKRTSYLDDQRDKGKTQWSINPKRRKELREIIWRNKGPYCYLCVAAGRPLAEAWINKGLPQHNPGTYEMDDKVPYNLGGDPLDEDNLFPAHRRCNSQKSNYPFEVAVARMRAQRQTSRVW